MKNGIFLEIRAIKNEKSFKNRLGHNLRKTNIGGDYKYKEQEFLNVIVDNRKILKELEFLKNPADDKLSKSDISRKISKTLLITVKIKMMMVS